jgi:hypothetical protein
MHDYFAPHQVYSRPAVLPAATLSQPLLVLTPQRQKDRLHGANIP